MPRKKIATTPTGTDEDQLAQLPAIVDALKMQVEALTGQVEVLRLVLDEIREDFQWALQNDRLRSTCTDERQFVHITSLPKDPCADHWEINRLKPDDLPPGTRRLTHFI